MTGPERPIAAAWLALRRSADSAARDRAGWLLDEFATVPGPLIVFDIGAGTGANQAYLQPRLGIESRWVLLDHDVHLLNAPGQGDAERVLGGIEQLDELVAARPGERLITCSALLDLLTADEVADLAQACAASRTAALFTLSVAGEVTLDPPLPEDDLVRRAFNEHQRREIDGRRLLGPDAPAAAVAAFEKAGATVVTRPSPWRLDSSLAGLTSEWLTGWVAAAVEQTPDLRLDDYLAVRTANPPAAVVGHVDLLAMFS